MTTDAHADGRRPRDAELAGVEVAAALAALGHAVFALMQPGSLDDVRPLHAPDDPAPEGVLAPVTGPESLPVPASIPLPESIPPGPIPVPDAAPDPAPASSSEAAEPPAYRPQARSSLAILDEISFLDD